MRSSLCSIAHRIFLEKHVMVEEQECAWHEDGSHQFDKTETFVEVTTTVASCGIRRCLDGWVGGKSGWITENSEVRCPCGSQGTSQKTEKMKTVYSTHSLV